MALNTNQQILELINRSHNILITTAEKDDGDGASAALALGLALGQNNHPADIIISEKISPQKGAMG